MTKDYSTALRQLEVFNYLEDDDFEIVRKHMFNYDYDTGCYVFREGTHGGYMFFIVAGHAEVIKQVDTRKTVIATLSAGRSIGEMSLIDGRPRSATVRAKTPLKLIVLKREDFKSLLTSYPATANNILMGIARLLSNSLRDTSNRFTEQMLSLC